MARDGTIAGVASFTGVGVPVRARGGSIAAAASLTGLVARILARGGSIPAVASLTGLAAKLAARSASMAGTATLTGPTAKIKARSGTVAGAATLNAYAVRLLARSAAIASVSALNGAGAAVQGRTGLIAGEARFTDAAAYVQQRIWGTLPQGPMYSYSTYAGNGVQTDFAVSFPYLLREHIAVSVSGDSRPFTWVNDGTIHISPAPAANAPVIIRRNSNRTARMVDYADSSTLTERDMDRDATQLLFIAQEALDQVTVGYAFDTDAAGARVMNVGTPIADTDAANKAWVQAYVASITSGGSDLIPLNNTWTGHNTFDQRVTIGGADLDPVEVATKDWLTASKAIFVNHTTNNTTQTGFGFVSKVSRTSGAPILVGGQFLAFGMGTFTGSIYGYGGEAWKSPTATGYANAMRAGVVNLNGYDSNGQRVGLDVNFKNREEQATIGGAAMAMLGLSGVGTAGNWYNANSRAIDITGQGRSDGGATYVGWNRGIRFRDGWCDVAKVQGHVPSSTYSAGDYALSSGTIYQAVQDVPSGVSATNTAYWTAIGGGTEMQAVGIDFSGVSSTTAGRMLCAIRLRGQMPIMWDTEAHISTKFDPATGFWSLNNAGGQVFAMEVGAKDLWVNGTPRIMGTRSSFSAHRGGNPAFISPGVFTNIMCAYKEYDYRTEYSTATGRFQPTSPGDYVVIGQFETDSTANEGQWINGCLQKNGVNVKGSSITCKAGRNTVQVYAVVALNGTTDYVTFMAWSALDNLLITGEPTATFFQGYKLA